MSMAEPVEITKVKRACATVAKKIGELKLGETDPIKTGLYERAEKWADDVVKAATMPEPSIDEKNWSAEFDGSYADFERAAAGELSASASLRKQALKDMTNLHRKFTTYNNVLKRGETLIEDILTEALVEQDGREKAIDYKLLSAIAPLKEVGPWFQGTVGPMNSILAAAGSSLFKHTNPELRDKIYKLGDGMGPMIDAFSLCADSSAGVVKISKDDRKLTDKLPLKQGETLLMLAVDDMLLKNLAETTERIVNQKKAEWGPDCEYIRVHFCYKYGKGAAAIKGDIKVFGEGADLQVGVEAIARARDGTMSINGRADIGTELSMNGFASGQGYAKVNEAILNAYNKARGNAQEKLKAKKELMKSGAGSALDSIGDYDVAPIPVSRTTVKAKYDVYPMDKPIEELVNDVETISKEAMAADPRVNMNIVYSFSIIERDLLIDSDGRKIDQSNVKTQGGFYTSAQQEGRGPNAHYDTMGGIGGFEVVDKGKNGRKTSLRDFVINDAKETAKLAGATPFPEELADGSGKLNVFRGEDGRLYTDGTIIPTGEKPQARLKHRVLVKNTAGGLIQHEIGPNGHVNEADRAIGLANNYAGGSLEGNFNETKIGTQVASKEITAGFDATTDGIAHCAFDREGTPAKGEVLIVEKGKLKTFMTNRHIADYLGIEPNPSTAVTQASRQELVRMRNTFIKNGKTPYDELVKKVGNGYILDINKTPSITAGRGNGFFEMGMAIPVVDGQVVYDAKTKEPYAFRNVGMMADSLDLWKNDFIALGDDGIEIMLSNCGKGRGNEMQAWAVSHFTPSFVSMAELRPGTDGGMFGYEIAADTICNYVRSFGRRG